MDKNSVKVINEVCNLRKIDDYVNRCVDLLTNVKSDILSFCMNFASAYNIDRNYALKRFLSIPDFNCFSKWFFLNIIYKIGIRVYPQNMFWLRESTAKKLVEYIPEKSLLPIMEKSSEFEVYNSNKKVIESVRLVNLKERHIEMLVDPVDGKFRSIDEQKKYAKTTNSHKSPSYIIKDRSVKIGNRYFTRDDLVRIISELDSSLGDK